MPPCQRESYPLGNTRPGRHGDTNDITATEIGSRPTRHAALSFGSARRVWIIAADNAVAAGRMRCTAIKLGVGAILNVEIDRARTIRQNRPANATKIVRHEEVDGGAIC